MAYEIEIRYVPLTHVVYIEATTPTAKISSTLGRLFQQVYQFLQDNQQHPTGPPYTRYLEWRGSDCVLQAGFPAPCALPDAGDVKCGELGECETAFTIHKGPYQGLTAAHQAVKEWIEQGGQEAGGAPWEVYMTDPGEHPDPSEWITAIYWPLA